jgi:biotin carboxylase
MTPKQKLAITALAVVDLLVITSLGLYGWLHRVPEAQLAGSAAAIPVSSPCVAFLIDSSAKMGWTARVSQTKAMLYYEVIFEAAPQAGPEAVWDILDSLSPEFAEACGTPETVTIAALAITDRANQARVAAQMAGSDLVPWLQGLISDSELASRSRYRSSFPQSH